jgi:hypothetical protein
MSPVLAIRRKTQLPSALPAKSPTVVEAVAIITPETLIRCHRRGFKAFWRWILRPSANVARSSVRRSGSHSLGLAIRSLGSSRRKWCIARRASSIRPAGAWLAAATVTMNTKVGKSLKALSAIIIRP